MLLGIVLPVAAVDHRVAVVQAGSAEAKGPAYRRLFENSKASDLALLQKDADTGIALQAAWELARVPMHKKRGVGRIDWTYDPKRTGEFIQFFGKRTSVVPPT